jgi:hypothetical protein
LDYRGKEFAALNGFCNGVDPNFTCPSNATSQTVKITQLTSWNGVNGNFVQAQVSQTEPTHLAKLLGLSTVTIGATGTAQVVKLANPCVLALSGAISFHDSAVRVDASNCGLASNSTTTGFNFQANPDVSKIGSMSTSGSCSGNSSDCNTVLTYAPTVPDPFSALDTAMTKPTPLTLTSCGKNAPLTAYTAGTPCANDGSTLGAITTSGVYFFSDLNLNGGGTLFTCTTTSPAPCNGKAVSATVILLPGATLRMTGTSVLAIAAQSTVSSSSLPSQLSSVADKLGEVAFYDIESGTPKINGNPTISFDGVLYVPNMNLSANGHPTITPLNPNSKCTELFAASIEFVGTPHFDNSQCPSSIVPKSQLVRLVP